MKASSLYVCPFHFFVIDIQHANLNFQTKSKNDFPLLKKVICGLQNSLDILKCEIF